MVVRSLPSRGRGGLVSSSSGAHALHRRVGLRVGRISRLRPSVRLVVSRCLSLFHQPLRVSGCLPCHPGFYPSPGQVRVSVHRQYVSSVLPAQGRGHALLHAQLRGSGHPSSLRGLGCSSAPPVCSGSPERLGRLSQSGWPSPRFRMDSPQGSVSRSFLPLAGHDGFIRHLHQPSPPGVFFPDGRSSGGGGGCSDPILGSSSGLRLPSVQVLSKVRDSHNLELTQVAPFWPLWPWFPDLLDLLVEVPVLLPQRRDLLRQPHFHQFHGNLRALGLTGFRIASDPHATSASLREWLANLPSPGALPLD